MPLMTNAYPDSYYEELAEELYDDPEINTPRKPVTISQMKKKWNKSTGSVMNTIPHLIRLGMLEVETNGRQRAFFLHLDE